MPFEKLPKTIRQAIEVASALGQRYLWIDCLCIIQNSTSDWAWQSCQMCSIYEHAVCTIAAESARNVDEGFFKTRCPLTYMPCELLSNNLNSMMGEPLWSVRHKIGDSELSNLERRGWCFQERLYSHRMLIFGNSGVTWICKQGEADEWNPEGEGTKRGPVEGVVNPRSTEELRTIFGHNARILNWEVDLDREGILYAGRGDFLSFSKRLFDGGPLSPQEVHRRWFGIMAPYSDTELTFESDRLVALAGIAALVTGFHYLAGIWRESLHFDLLWTLEGHLGSGRRACSLAPTWSWAFIRGKVLSWVFWGYDVPPEDLLCSYEGCDIQRSDPADVHNIGAVFSASLTIRGKVRCMPYICPSLWDFQVEREQLAGLQISKGSTTIYHPSGAVLGQLHPDTTFARCVDRISSCL